MNSDGVKHLSYKKINERHRSWSDVTDILEEELIDNKTVKLLNYIMIILVVIILLTVYSQLIMPS